MVVKFKQFVNAFPLIIDVLEGKTAVSNNVHSANASFQIVLTNPKLVIFYKLEQYLNAFVPILVKFGLYMFPDNALHPLNALFPIEVTFDKFI